jgi:putative transposase
VRVSRKRVARLMRQAGLSGLLVRRRGKTTIRVPGVRPAPDLVGRDFNPTEPNRLWAADLTEIPTWEGVLNLAGVIDCYSRRVVGWAMAEHRRAELVVEAIEMAVWQRKPTVGLVHHSDQGSQGGFTRSSQHLDVRGGDGQAGWVDEGVDGAFGDEVAGQAVASS